MDFFPRVGGGNGVTRMISAIEKMKQVNADKKLHTANPMGMIQKGTSIL